MLLLKHNQAVPLLDYSPGEGLGATPSGAGSNPATASKLNNLEGEMNTSISIRKKLYQEELLSKEDFFGALGYTPRRTPKREREERKISLLPSEVKSDGSRRWAF